MEKFMPKQYKTQPTTIRIPFELLERIDQAAAEANLSRSALINQCVEYALENMSSTNQEEE